MLEGAFYTDVHANEQYIIAYHKKAVDHYSNFCGRIRTLESEAECVLDEIIEFFMKHKRKPSFLVSPFSEPKQLPTLLKI